MKDVPNGRTKFLATLIFLAVSASLTACSVHDQAVAPSRGPTNALATRDLQTPDNLAARAKVAWVGALHNAGLADLAANRKSWLGQDDRNLRAVCSGFTHFGEKYALLAEAQSGITRSLDARREDVRAAVNNALHACESGVPLNIFGGHVLPLFHASMDEGDTDDDLEPYLNLMYDAVAATDGTPSAVDAAANGVLASAGTSVSAADYSALAATASLAVSSSQYWSDLTPEAACGAWGYCPNEMSLFRARRTWGVFLGIGIVDLAGCIAGELSAYHSGMRRQEYLYTECGIWGVLASGAAVASLAK